MKEVFCYNLFFSCNILEMKIKTIVIFTNFCYIENVKYFKISETSNCHETFDCSVGCDRQHSKVKTQHLEVRKQNKTALNN